MKKDNNKDNNNKKEKLNNSDMYVNQTELESAIRKTLDKQVSRKGIGTLGEKTLHSVLKLYFEPDEDKHEVALDGYFADIYNQTGVIEIQTRQLNKLRDKLAVFLNHYTVTVVYPCPYNKWIYWVDPETLETTGKKRLSSRHYNEYDAFFELYKIKSFLKNPNLHIRLLLMDVEDYKLLNGWNETGKKGSWRYDRIPVGVRRIIELDQPEDYMTFLPLELKEKFTVKDYSKTCGISEDTARMVLNILYYLGVVSRVGKEGNAFLYEAAAH